MKQEHNFAGKSRFSSMPMIKKPFTFQKEQLRDIIESFLMLDYIDDCKKPLLLTVMENNASFSVFDGFTIIPVKFTDKSLSATCLKMTDDGTQIKLGDLKNTIIVVT